MAGVSKLIFWLLFLIALSFSNGCASENFAAASENTIPVDTTLSFYLSQINNGVKGEEIYFNTSRVYYLNGDYPASILYAEKALKWNPHCTDCQTLLELALKKSDLERFELPGWSPMAKFEKLSQIFSYQTWFGIAMIFLSLHIALYFGWFFSEKLTINQWSKRLLPPITFLVLMFSAHSYYLLNSSRYWILMENNTGLRLSADNNSEYKMKLNAGTKLLKTDQIGSWYKVRTLAFDEGWIEEKYLRSVSK